MQAKEETKKRKSSSHKRLMQDPEFRARRVSYLAKSYGHSKGCKAHNSVPVICLNDGTLYSSVTEAAIKLGLDHSTVCAVVRGRFAKTKGYSFRRAMET